MTYKGDIFYIEQVLSGNSNAFRFLIDHHKNSVYNLVFRICGNHEEAEEIAQDTFLKAYRSLRNFKMKSTFATWLFRIGYNTAISHIRIKKKGTLSLEDFPADAVDFISSGATEDDAENEFRKSLINFALQKINSDERGLICLYYYEEMNIEEMSYATGISKSNIKVKLFRIRQKMIEIIEKAERKKLIYHE